MALGISGALWAALGISFICVAPGLLMLLGVDLSSPGGLTDMAVLASMSAGEAADALHSALRGSFLHTLLEWSAVCAAVLTVALAVAHFRVSDDVTPPILAAALFWAGGMDAFHTLAADRLIEATADNHDLIPFSWAICRLFNAAILLGGVGMAMAGRSPRGRARQIPMISASAVGMGLLAYAVIHYCATEADLPQTMFPGALVTRPWDVAPLVLYAIAGLVVFPAFHRRNRSNFSLALWLSAIPHVATQLYMAFGSDALFDAPFNIAHGLKVVAYLVPFGGLLQDYVSTHRAERGLREELLALNQELEARVADRTQELSHRTDELAESNRELERFAYVASHDLQEPLRKIQAFSGLLVDRAGDGLDEKSADYLRRVTNSATRMRQLIDDLLLLSRMQRGAVEFISVPLGPVLQGVLDDLEIALAESGGEVEAEALPTIHGDLGQLRSLLQNLIGNALKYRDPDRPPRVRIRASEADEAGFVELTVQDNGIGFEDKFAKQVFEPFRRLHGRSRYSGTGIGLAVCHQIARRHGGSIRAVSTLGEGAAFHIRLPVDGRALGDVGGLG